MKRMVLIGTMAAAALLLGTGGTDSGALFGAGPKAAGALDLFGSGDRPEEEASKSAGGEAFWRSDSGIETAQPIGIPTSFADLAERVAPAVVSIQTSGTVPIGAPALPPGFEDFFGNPWNSPHGGGGRAPERKSSGEGSGFVISTDGYIVTNNHVIEDADDIKVLFKDGTELEAKIIGRDPKTDIALVKVEPKGKTLKTIALGDSDAVRAGDWVVAIGNPFGLEHTVTAGIVSAKHRRDVTNQSYEDFIQTDAAINPGNSGGPLIDLSGRVIGINTAIRSNANTIGFSVPINQAKQILPQLRADGRVTRGWLGVQIQAVTPELAPSFGLDAPTGALVSQVLPETPAAKGGIERGDVIVEFNGEPIKEWRDLPIVVANAKVDRKAPVVLYRDGKKKTLNIRIAVLEDPEEVALTSVPDSGPEVFGLQAQDLTPALAAELGIESTDGVIVTQVDPNGPAASAGIVRGDIIVEIDQKSVRSSRDLVRKLEGADESVLVLIRRGENTLYVPLKKAG